MAIVLVGGVLLSLLFLLLVPPIVAFILGYAFVVFGMRWYVERARAKRRDAFMDQLPDLARMLSNGTQAGLSIAGAVQMAARELDDPEVPTEMPAGGAHPLDQEVPDLRAQLGDLIGIEAPDVSGTGELREQRPCTEITRIHRGVPG